MKPKIQERKRMGFIMQMISLAVIILSTLLVFNSCQKDDDSSEKNLANQLKSTTSMADDGYVTYYQNELFIRFEGKPVIVKRQIGKPEILEYEDCFILNVRSGYDGADFVSSAIVKIDGNTVLNTSDFSNTNQSFQIELCQLTETSVMEVQINGTPGSTLEIWINGKLKISTGLIAFYPFNGNANDESGNGNNGTVNGAALTNDRFGNENKAYMFDGTSNFISVNSQTISRNAVTEDYTLTCWVKMTSIPTDHAHFIFDRDKTLNWSLHLLFDPRKDLVPHNCFGANIVDGSSYAYVNSKTTPLVNQWYFIVKKVQNKRLYLYINGVAEDSVNIPSQMVSTKNTEGIFTIGGRFNNGDDTFLGYFPGIVDDVHVYDRALSRSEIQTLYYENGWIPSSGTFIDSRDGHVYKWVRICDKIWMAENLAYLPSVNTSSEYSDSEPRYYVCGNETNDIAVAKATYNYNAYGVLYNWPAVMQGSVSSNANPSGVRGISPVGWHIPSDQEWIDLVNCIGGYDVAGGKMKETGTVHWDSPNTVATNEFGFTALPAGYFNYRIYYGGIGTNLYLWSATRDSEIMSRHMSLNSDNPPVVLHESSYFDCAFSVRCIKD
jgi:uncharacterized protein (TIGR02145 family)